MTKRERTQASVAIGRYSAGLVESRGARTVSAFWPLAEEPDLRPLLRALRASGVTVALPVVTSGRGETPVLEHRLFGGDDALAPGRFGVMEPLAPCPLVAPEAVEVALVPALAVDRDGVRLGYGGGFYDAYLVATEAYRVGIVLASGVVASLPSEAHDARLDAWVSEHGASRPRTPYRNTGGASA